MDFGEVIFVIVGAFLAWAPFVYVFVALPAFWGWKLALYWRER